MSTYINCFSHRDDWMPGRSNLREKFILGSLFKGYSPSGKGGID